jgi:hypothetical protein
MGEQKQNRTKTKIDCSIERGQRMGYTCGGGGLPPPPSAEGRVAEATVSLVNQNGSTQGGGGEEVCIREHRMSRLMRTSWNQLTSNTPH